MPRGPCPGCGLRLPYAARRCRRCGWRHRRGEGAPRGGRMLRRVVLACVLVGMALFGLSRVDPVALADWYAGFALRHLSQHFAPPVPGGGAEAAP